MTISPFKSQILVDVRIVFQLRCGKLMCPRSRAFNALCFRPNFRAGKSGRPIAQANIQLELPEFDPKNLPEWAEEFAEFLLLTGQSHVDVATKCSQR